MGLRTGAQSGPYTGAATPSPGAALQTNLGSMVSASQYVHDVADMMYGQLQKLRSTLDGLQGSWTSSAASTYQSVCLTWDTQCSSLRQALYDIGDGLAQSHKLYNETELNNQYGITKAAEGITY